MLEERKVAKLAKCDKDSSKKSKLKKVVDESSSDENSDYSLEDDNTAECVGCGVQYSMSRFNYNEEDMKKTIDAVKKGSPIATAAKTFEVPRMTLSDKCKAEMNQTVHSDKVVAVDESSSIQGQTSELNISVNLFLPAPEQVVNQDTPIKKNMTLEESLQNNKEKDILADIPSPFKNNFFGQIHRKWRKS
ncbi:hypothetical protein FQR65_LT14875 [Abscondita terminalis]|nr:hypothetical protein FQR65_LT14875 [Abscondita terminalis]